MRSSRCLVLGGRGFIGSHLVDGLSAAGYAVRSFDRPNVASSSTANAARASVEEVEGDFTRDTDVAEAVKDCQYVFHLVSTTLPQSSNLDPVFDVETNVRGSIRLLEHARLANVRRVVFVSSGGTVYGIPREAKISEDRPTDPICSYGIAKLAIEKCLHLFRKLHGLEFVVLRLSNPFGERQRTGSGQGAVAAFLDKALRGEPVEIWGDGTVVRDYIHIEDVVRALLLALTHAGPSRVFNIGSGIGSSLNELLAAIEASTGLHPERRYMNARPFDAPRCVLSVERAKSELGWSPRVGLAEGLARTLA